MSSGEGNSECPMILLLYAAMREKMAVCGRMRERAAWKIAAKSGYNNKINNNIKDLDLEAADQKI